MTVVPRPRGRAEVEHPPWCDAENCPLSAVAAGMPHQSRELPVVVDGVRYGSVVLQQHASGPLLVGLAMRGMAWPPGVAEAMARAVDRAVERARVEAGRG